MWDLSGAFLGLCLIAVTFGGWITHIVTCFSDGLWGFLVAGAIFVPVGVIHGIGIWFGAW